MANRFDNLGYNAFRSLALDPTLSANEKIGFPDSYRAGFGAAIHEDITAKLSNLRQPAQRVLDIGPGCAELAHLLIGDWMSRGHRVVLVDSQEMLSQLPSAAGITKVAGFYPDCHPELASAHGPFDVILCYSVFHYVFVEAHFWRFIDRSLQLLAPSGQMLIGDIPNSSKRKRFFASDNGARFHQAFMNTTERPVVDFNVVEIDKIDDAVLLGVIGRVRAQGCDAYWLPQPPRLPMANRREDILICKP